MKSSKLTEVLVLRNEFAAVRLEMCTDANGVRLKIIDLDSNHMIILDPFEVASLVWATSDQFDKLAKPL